MAGFTGRSRITELIFARWLKVSPVEVTNLDVDIYSVETASRTSAEALINLASYKDKNPDLTILVGDNCREFQVHKELAVAKSKFFRAACSVPRFREGVEMVVRLPEIDTESMARLIGWFYDSRLDLPADLASDEGYEITLNLLNAADFLEIRTVIDILTRATQNYIWKCKNWKDDTEQAEAEEQRKVDLMCRLYECGGKIDALRLGHYLKNLREAHKMGIFINAVKEVEDCHPDFFTDTMVAVYSTV